MSNSNCSSGEKKQDNFLEKSNLNNIDRSKFITTLNYQIPNHDNSSVSLPSLFVFLLFFLPYAVIFQLIVVYLRSITIHPIIL